MNHSEIVSFLWGVADLILAGDEERIARPGVVRSVYDPCCGSGGMLMIAKEHITSGGLSDGNLLRPAITAQADIHLFGQEVNPETWAVSKSDVFMKDPTGRDADNIAFGNTLSNDRHTGRNFDYLIANPPYGKDWKRDKDTVKAEHERGAAGRFGPGLPRISDGQTLFLLHMLAHAKAPARKGKVQLIDATTFWSLLRRSLGDKRREIPAEKADDVLKLLADYRDGETRKLSKDGKEEVIVSRIFPTTQFGYRKITVERPLRLNFQASAERIARLDQQRGFLNLSKSRKRGHAGVRKEAEGRVLQRAIVTILKLLPGTLRKDREAFLAELATAAAKADLKLPAPVKKAILTALAERDETAAVCRGKDDAPEPDLELRDTERVPLVEGEDAVDGAGVPASVRAFFEREVAPHVAGAWIDTKKHDRRDGNVGLVGYEINFNRYFYQYKPPRPLEEIQADIQSLQYDIVGMLANITSGTREESTP